MDTNPAVGQFIWCSVSSAPSFDDLRLHACMVGWMSFPLVSSRSTTLSYLQSSHLLVLQAGQSQTHWHFINDQPKLDLTRQDVCGKGVQVTCRSGCPSPSGTAEHTPYLCQGQ